MIRKITKAHGKAFRGPDAGDFEIELVCASEKDGKLDTAVVETFAQRKDNKSGPLVSHREYARTPDAPHRRSTKILAKRRSPFLQQQSLRTLPPYNSRII